MRRSGFRRAFLLLALMGLNLVVRGTTPAADRFFEIGTSGPGASLDAIAPRSGQTAVWTGTLMLVWGGTAGTTTLNDGARYDPVTDTWTPISTAGAPSPRTHHTAVWTGHRMIVWGGTSGGIALGDGARYDPVADAWSPLSSEGAPEARAYHSAVWTGTEMIVWGGSHGSSETSDALGSGARYDPRSDRWSAVSTADAPAPRAYHVAVWTGRRMIVWGGADASSDLRSGGSYDPENDSWTPVSTYGAPSRRLAATAIWTGRSMVVWGGVNRTPLREGYRYKYLKSGGRYDPSTNTWSRTNLDGAPAGRVEHTAVWTGGEMIVWGGFSWNQIIPNDGTTVYRSGGRYDPATDSWAHLSRRRRPEARMLHTAIWTGHSMVIWGGEAHFGWYFYAPLSTGARYNPVSDSWIPLSTP